MNLLADEIRAYIKREKITQAIFAERSGLDPSTISRIVNSVNSPKIEQLDKMGAVLGKSAGALAEMYLGHPIEVDVYAIARRITELPADSRERMERYIKSLLQPDKQHNNTH